MAEDEVAHVGGAAAVTAHIDEERVGAREETQGVHHRVAIVAAGEARDLEIADVAVEDLGAAHPEVEQPGIAEGARGPAGWGRRILRIAKAKVEIAVHRAQVARHHLGELCGIVDGVVGPGFLFRS